LGGNFPLWLAPVQIAILPISDAHHAFAKEIDAALKMADIRTEIHLESESLGKKIRSVKVAKIPYTLVIGDQEVADKKATLEGRGEKIGQLGTSALLALLQKEILEKKA
jgi:threonyl-tRNA synthetase